ncbi:ATP-binding domain-containing protein [Undibacterium sp. Ji50W]|uniref:ATP-binding domain-containing protein n=1 Tax=Undibacterium sp. Ji50W TaxID=3413041 RepID=UPI003BF441E1
MGVSTMTVRAFMGGAGCGKTYELMRSLSDHLVKNPLKNEQKVLALTFMHGSRRRLEERLGQLKALKGRTDCSTIDSFAWHLVRRWVTLAAALGFTDIQPSQYERVCDAAGALLQLTQVRSWVAATFPILLVDEAQDMTSNRLRIVEGLAGSLEIFAAADEFQCLKEELRPNPACTWLNQVCQVKELTQPRRTNITELLDAATAIRRGEAPKSQKNFIVQLTSKAPLAGAWLNGNLQWYGGGKSVAVITPAVGTFAPAVMAWAAQNKTKRGSGPYSILWEKSEVKTAASFLKNIALEDENDASSVIDLLTLAGDSRATRDISNWLDMQRRARGKTVFSKEEIEQAIEHGFSQRQRDSKGDGGGWRGMTVHGAKNREFDNVIVLWPAAIGGSDDQKRRLLYNAVTRAKERCLILVQAKAIFSQAPFA